MTMTAKEITNLIKESIPDATVEIKDLGRLYVGIPNVIFILNYAFLKIFLEKNKRSSFNILLKKLEIIDTNSCDIIVA